MAGSVNKVIIIGNLGKDPEVRTTNAGNKVVNLSVATSETWRDKNSGERQERTEWHRVVIWNKGLAEVAEKYLKKGSKVYIEGQLQTRKWTDKDEIERYSTEIVLNPYKGEIKMLDTKGKGGSRDDDDDDSGQYDYGQDGDGGGRQSSGGGGGTGRRASGPIDDDIPFAPCVD